MNRRSLILGATLGVAVPSLVKAESLIDIPGDPLTKRGLFAASKWAEEAYRTQPACRLVFADGKSTGWMEYKHLSRPAEGEPRESANRTFAVAIEVSATDVHGNRFVTSVPIDGQASERLETKRIAAEQEARRQHALMMKEHRERYVYCHRPSAFNRPSLIIGCGEDDLPC